MGVIMIRRVENFFSPPNGYLLLFYFFLLNGIPLYDDIYSIFLSDDEILLKIININKFNHKYLPIKSYFVIGISLKRLFFFLLEVRKIISNWMFNLNCRRQNFGFLMKILITKYDFLGQYLSLNLLILSIVNKIWSSEIKIQYIYKYTVYI